MNVLKPSDATIISPSELQARLFAAQRPAPALPARLFATLKLWWMRHQERQLMRRDLEGFTPEMLEDLRMTRQQAEALANRPFWRA